MMFTLPGSPGLYYGDEIGLPGWTIQTIEDLILGGRETEEGLEILQFTRELIKVYKNSTSLRRGSFDFIDWQKGYLAYASWNKEESIVTIVNREEKVVEVEIPLWLLDKKKGEIEILFSTKEVDIKNKYYNEGRKNLKIPEKLPLL